MNTTIKTFETVRSPDYPRFPGEAEHNEMLNTLLTSEAASELLNRTVDKAVAHARAKGNMHKRYGQERFDAAADLRAMAIELYIERDLLELHDYVAANHVVKRVMERIGLATFTRDGLVCTAECLDYLRWLLRDNARAIVNLAVRQAEIWPN